jgi:hypothetical protein
VNSVLLYFFRKSKNLSRIGVQSGGQKQNIQTGIEVIVLFARGGVISSSGILIFAAFSNDDKRKTTFSVYTKASILVNVLQLDKWLF